MLITQDFQGQHHADIEHTYARLLQGFSWKKQRVVIVMPSADTIHARVVLSWLNLLLPPNQAHARVLALGCEVGEAYTSAVHDILHHKEWSEWEDMLTIEHDNLPPPEGALRLFAGMEQHPEYAAIGGLYFKTGREGQLCAEIWGDITDPEYNARPQLPRTDGGLVECYGVPMGFTVWRLDMFKDTRLRKPWFKTFADCTQDLYFWEDAQRHGYRCAIDCGTKVGHYDVLTDTIH